MRGRSAIKAKRWREATGTAHMRAVTRQAAAAHYGITAIAAPHGIGQGRQWLRPGSSARQ